MSRTIRRRNKKFSKENTEDTKQSRPLKYDKEKEKKKNRKAKEDLSKADED